MLLILFPLAPHLRSSPSGLPAHVPQQVSAVRSTATTHRVQHASTSIETWRSDINSATSDISSVTPSSPLSHPSSSVPFQPPAQPSLPNMTLEVELQELGVHNAQELPANWRSLRGSRPRGGWTVYAVLVGRQRGILHDAYVHFPVCCLACSTK